MNPTTRQADTVGNDTRSEIVQTAKCSDQPDRTHQNRPVSFPGIRWLFRVPVALDIGLAAYVCLLILVASVDKDHVVATLFGFLFVQVLLAAVWTSLAQIRLFTRAVVGTLVVLYHCLCMYRCADRDGSGTSTAVDSTGTSRRATSLQFGLNLTLGQLLIAMPDIWGCLSRQFVWLWSIAAKVDYGLVFIIQRGVFPGPMIPSIENLQTHGHHLISKRKTESSFCSPFFGSQVLL